MRKFYLLALGLVLGATSVNAQVVFNDDFESYPAGSYFDSRWSNWSGASGAENLIISTAYASSGTKSGAINTDNQDVILKVPSAFIGVHTYQWKMYIPANKSAWLAFMEDTSTPATYASDPMPFKMNFNTNTVMGGTNTNNYDNKMYCTLYFDEESVSLTPPITYPIGEWATYKVVFDLDNALVSLYINDTVIFSTEYTSPALAVGGADIWKFPTGSLFINGSTSTNDACEWYFDDFIYAEGEFAAVQDATANSFSVYPTVVDNQVFNISGKSKISSVEVYSLAGQQVLKLAPNATSVQVNASKLTPGTYVVNVTGEHTKLSKKIIVK